MILKNIIKWFLSLFYWRKKKPSVKSTFNKEKYKFKFVSELPDDVNDNIVYLEGNKETNEFWYALLKCPCGCNEKIMLNLMEDAKPCWKIHLVDDNLTITPSIWRTKNCESHFFLRNNKIVWSD